MKHRTTPEKITELRDNEILVVPINIAGRHGAGLAKFAYKKGWVGWGEGIGMSRSRFCYCFPTKDRKIKSLPLADIGSLLWGLIREAKLWTCSTFLVPEIGCGLAGYTPEQIAPLFRAAIEIENIHLPASFWEVLNKEQ